MKIEEFWINMMDVCLFAGCSISAVHFTCLPNGRPSGAAYVEFRSEVTHKTALKLFSDKRKPVSGNIEGEFVRSLL